MEYISSSRPETERTLFNIATGDIRPLDPGAFLVAATAFAKTPIPDERAARSGSRLFAFYETLLARRTRSESTSAEDLGPAAIKELAGRASLRQQDAIQLVVDNLVIPHWISIIGGPQSATETKRPDQQMSRLLLRLAGVEIDRSTPEIGSLFSHSTTDVLDAVGQYAYYPTVREAVVTGLSALPPVPDTTVAAPSDARETIATTLTSGAVNPSDIVVETDFDELDRLAVIPQTKILEDIVAQAAATTPARRTAMLDMIPNLTIREAQLAIAAVLVTSQVKPIDRLRFAHILLWRATGKTDAEISDEIPRIDDPRYDENLQRVIGTPAPSTIGERRREGIRAIASSISVDSLEQIIANNGTPDGLCLDTTVARFTESSLQELARIEAWGGQVMLPAWRDQARPDRLTAVEEVELSQIIQKGLESKNRRIEIEAGIASGEFTEADFGDVLTALRADERELESAVTRFILGNRGMALKRGRFYAAKYNVEAELAIDAANQALYEAILDFDYTLGVKFSTFVWRRFAQRIRQLRDRRINIPIRVMEHMATVDREITASIQTRGRPPTTQEIVSNTHLTVDQVDAVMAAKNALEVASNDDTVRADPSNRSTLGGFQADPQSEAGYDDVITQSVRKELLEELEHMFTFTANGEQRRDSELRHPRSQEDIRRDISICLLHFGFTGAKYSYPEIAAIVGLKDRKAVEFRIRQITSFLQEGDNKAILLSLLT